MSAQPDHAPVTPYAPAPEAPVELLAQLRADRRADRWVAVKWTATGTAPLRTAWTMAALLS
jgi:hypothetical protein